MIEEVDCCTGLTSVSAQNLKVTMSQRDRRCLNIEKEGQWWKGDCGRAVVEGRLWKGQGHSGRFLELLKRRGKCRERN